MSVRIPRRLVGEGSRKMWKLLKATVLSFIEDEALSRGAAIAFYTVTSLAPILLIVVAIAGLAFGREAAQHAITAQLTGLMGTQTADVLQSALAGASSKSSGILATIIGIVTLLVTASGVFGEMQTALNKIWDVEPRTSTVSRLIWARAVSLGLVAALGFLLLVSLVVSAALTAFGTYLNSVLPFGSLILSLLNFVVSLALISVLFAAIYKVLPDRPIAWRDVITGAIVTALLFTAGKSLDRLVSRQQRGGIELRRRGRSDHTSSLGLLLDPDLPPRCRVHQSLCILSAAARIRRRARQTIFGRRKAASERKRIARVHWRASAIRRPRLRNAPK